MRAEQLPLTVKDVSLMLRAGYSSNSLMQELSTRHFADTVDANKESVLRKAGASEDLIDKLTSGRYSLSPKQMALAQDKINDLAKRQADQAEIARNTSLYQSEVAKSTASRRTAAANSISEIVKGDLVQLHYGDLTHFDDDALEQKKLIALYFSAHWCAPCRKFTPQLVDFYNRVAPQHPEFELIFVSDDKSQFAFETYMHDANMPWPAIDYQKLAGKDGIRKYAGAGIPCLVVVDQNGAVVTSSFSGKQSFGPEKVLSDLDAIFAGKPLPQMAALR